MKITMLTSAGVRTAISLCGHRQALRHALGLIGEMRARSIACNTHTYSALMNVAIKCGELELALDVFQQLQVTCSENAPSSASACAERILQAFGGSM